MGFITKSNVTGTGDGSDSGASGVLLKGNKDGTGNLGAGLSPWTAKKVIINIGWSANSLTTLSDFTAITLNRRDIDNTNIMGPGYNGMPVFETTFIGHKADTATTNRITLRYGDTDATVVQDRWMLYVSDPSGSAEPKENLIATAPVSGPLGFHQAGDNAKWVEDWRPAGAEASFSGRSIQVSGSSLGSIHGFTPAGPLATNYMFSRNNLFGQVSQNTSDGTDGTYDNIALSAKTGTGSGANVNMFVNVSAAKRLITSHAGDGYDVGDVVVATKIGNYAGTNNVEITLVAANFESYDELFRLGTVAPTTGAIIRVSGTTWISA